MFVKRLTYLFLVVCIAAFSSFSQNQNKKWYFGNYAGLDFMTSPPTILTNGSTNVSEGCSSIADASGNLLFYTDGATVWDQTHATMANGTGLLGTGTPAQGALIVKKPGSSTLYYIFTLKAGTGGDFCYSIVDMTLAAGMGSVTTKNAAISSGNGEKMTGTRHCNGVDYWIVTHEANTANFNTYSLTASGINTTAVVSTLGNSSISTYGYCMKISPNGKKLGLTLHVARAIELYDFNNSTGAITNSLNIPLNASSGQAYGCEFSPDGTKFYASVFSPGYVFQFDLCAGSDSAIAASQTSLTSSGIKGSLQLAPNGKIYVARGGASDLGVINSPNLLGTACSYTDVGQSLSTGTCQFGLPNMITSYRAPSPPFTYTVSNNFGCQAAAFTASSSSNYTTVGCSVSGYSLQGVLWNFGDPASGSANTTGSSNPVHAFSSLGTYTVSLILYYSCGGGTDTLRQAVNINQSCISVGSTSITCASLGSATVTALYGLGPFSYTWMPSSQTTSVATGLSPGTYTIFVHDAGNNFTYSATTVFTSLIPLTGNVNNSSSVSCNGAATATANVTNITGGSGAQSYHWYNGVNSYTTTSPVTLSAGVWSVTVTDSLTGCQINQTFYISQPPPLNLVISSNTPSACVGGSIVLTATNSGGTPGYSYTWANGPVGNTITVSKPTGGIYVYTLTSLDANNCSGSNTIAITFISNPVLSVSNVSICPLATGVLTVSGASTYTWSNNSIGNTLVDNPVANSQYTVIGSAQGCTSSAVASISLKTVPPAFIAGNAPVCNGSNLMLTGLGGSSFLWSGPNSFVASLQTVTLTNISSGNAGVYQLTVTASNSCTNSTTQTVIVLSSPTLAASAGTVCTSQSLNLSVNTAANSFTWTGPLNFISNLQNASIINPLITNSGTYTVKVTSAQGCTNSATAIASVVLPPSLTASLSSSGTLCAQALNGSPNTITLTSGGASTYTLFTPYHINNSNPSGPVSQLSTMPPYTSGPATATLMGSNGVCTVSTTVTFSVIPNPLLTALTPTPVICAGQSFTYTSFGANSYTWGPGSPNLSTYTSPVTVASPTQTSIYTIVGGSLGCNSGTQTSTITVLPLPGFSVSPTKPLICLNDKITLLATGNASSYTWAPYSGLNSMTGFTVSANPLSQQTYTVLGTLNSCTNQAMVTVSVLPLPNPTAGFLKDKLCLNSVVTMSATGGISYNWSGPNGLLPAGQTTSFIATSNNFSGTYTVMATDSNGCKNKATTDLIIYNSPGGNLEINNKEACVPFISSFNTTVSNSSVKYQWTLEDKFYTTKKFSHAFTSPGSYTINGKFVDTLSTCTGSTSFVIKANPNPVANFSFLPEKPIENLDEVIFTNTSQGEQQIKWNWYFADNKGYQSENKNTSYLFSDAGVYPVAMKVTNVWGCSDTVIKVITISPDLAIYVPNAFTPNGDDLNDVFIPVTRTLKYYELSVFDRWGARVFHTTDTQLGWDGTFRGQECKVDVYVWKISLSSLNGEMKTLTGHVTLSR